MVNIFLCILHYFINFIEAYVLNFETLYIAENDLLRN